MTRKQKNSATEVALFEDHVKYALKTCPKAGIFADLYACTRVPLSPRSAAAAFSRLAIMAVPPTRAKDMAASTLGSMLPGAK